jgi:hypothetical protein
VLCGTARGAGDRISVRSPGEGRAVVVPLPWADWVTVGINGVERREPGREGSDKQRLVMLALAALLVYVAALGRAVKLFRETARLSVRLWSRGAARSPPSFAV